MSYLQNISLYQFRNYKQLELAFNLRVICISGKNGVGKTNLLDAIYILCFTKSYFTNIQKVLLQNGTAGYRISGNMERKGEVNSLACIFKDGKKEFYCQDVVYDKLGEHIGKYSAVMIAPDDLSFINEGGEERRKWMDGLLCQLDKQYLNYLLHYYRVLAQRNAWLKMPGSQSPHLLAFYNSEMQAAGDYIYKKRNALLKHLLPKVQELYLQLSNGKEHMHWEYQSQLHQNNMAQVLEGNAEQDYKMQRTHGGIHRDDIALFLDNAKVKSFASQGQKKSLLFAIKLCQYFYLAQERKHPPILLLDDVFEKLDNYRVQALMHIIGHADVGQVFITDTDEKRLRQLFHAQENVQFINMDK